jgi:hypothetical protein
MPVERCRVIALRKSGRCDFDDEFVAMARSENDTRENGKNDADTYKDERILSYDITRILSNYQPIPA